MSAMKTMMVHVLDSSNTMNETFTSSTSNLITKFSLAKSAISSFLLQRMLVSKTIEFGLLRFGGDEEDVSFVEECIVTGRSSLETLKIIHDSPISPNPGDIFEALDAAHKIVMETNQGKKYNRVIVLFSDGESNLLQDNESYELSQNIKNDGCILFIVLLIESSKIELLASNIQSIKEFVNNAQGYLIVTSDLPGIMKFLSGGPGMGTRPTQNKITFELSPDFKIPCVYSGLTSKVSLPSLKKQSNISYDSDIPDSGKVTLSTVYRNPSNPDEELQIDERVKGYKYGPQYIPFGGMDDNILKLISPPIIKLLGFISSDKIPRHHYIDCCYILGTNHSTPEGASARKVIASIGLALKKLNQVALVRFVKRENSDPWLGVLIPPKEEENLEDYRNGSLYLHRLPCAEDIRNFLFPPLPTNFSNNQKETILPAIESMTFKGQLGPHGLLMYNPAMLALLSTIQQKINAIDTPLKGTSNFDGTFKSLGDTNRSISLWQQVKEQFPLIPSKQNENGNKKRKIYWADFEMNTTTESTITNIKSEDQKKIKLLPALHEGSIQPVDEFMAILEMYRKIDISNHIEQSNARAIVRESIGTLARIIDLLISNGGTNAHYQKAISCIKIMRDGAIEVGEHNVYNEFMIQFKSSYRIGRHSKVWEKILTEGITLISNEDTTFPCSTTRIDANDYLNTGSITIVPTHTEVITDAKEEDDLFEEMM